ncbi:MAG: sigma-70 family RNA polymerase sigma factor [candidate division WOR-3 bacterium]|nr:sigma-70 family RNA polymerase sigma factor [candidate division WOR-3 bacterium]
MKMADETVDQDLKLVKMVVDGDELAFEELVKKYQHPVLNTIYRYIGNFTEAEDIAQDVFVRVWQNIKGFKGKSKFSTWLYRIVVNRCLDYKRKKKAVLVALDKTLEQGKIPESLTVELDFERKRKAAIVRKAIKDLPDNQRIALILSKFEAKSYQAIADIMGISLASVASLIFRAKDNLKTKLLPLREKGII